MRYIFFTISMFLLLSTGVFAQFEITKKDKTIINDKDVFTFNKIGKELAFNIHNTTKDTVYIKFEVKDIKNANGEKSTLCIFEQCYPPTDNLKGKTYPEREGKAIVPEGNTSPEYNDHFVNNNDKPLNNATFIEYIFNVSQVNKDGSAKDGGKSVTFSYKYDPSSVGVKSTKNTKYKLYPTVGDGVVYLETKKTVNIQLCSITGNKVENIKVNSGKNTLNLSHLKPQIYLVIISDEYNNKIGISKIIIN